MDSSTICHVSFAISRNFRGFCKLQWQIASRHREEKIVVLIVGTII